MSDLQEGTGPNPVTAPTTSLNPLCSLCGKPLYDGRPVKTIPPGMKYEKASRYHRDCVEKVK